MDQAPYIATKDLPKVTPTKCSMLCSSSDIKPDLILDVVLTCATTAVASREFVLVDGAIDAINISTPRMRRTSKKQATAAAGLGGWTNGGDSLVRLNLVDLSTLPLLLYPRNF
uniref:Uncharacterized protein n=1 Tax=Oryza glumipatula TaxID=40148 RepID=A0A0E0AM65_9ORYZ